MEQALQLSHFQQTISPTNHVAKTSSKRAYVSDDSQWVELHDVFVMLWPGMALAELAKVMEEDYGFRATQDQYKKKFQHWTAGQKNWRMVVILVAKTAGLQMRLWGYSRLLQH
ncbi:hypothetical protein BKA63DRAFT_608579, partial [Paraphoma chrysanthemicola]